MGRVGTAVGLQHVLGVTVIGCHHARAPVGVHRRHDLAEAGVDRLDRLNGRLDHARVADHVGVGEVDDRERRALL